MSGPSYTASYSSVPVSEQYQYHSNDALAPADTSSTALYSAPSPSKGRSGSRLKKIIIGAVVGFLLALAITLALIFTVGPGKRKASSKGTSDSSGSENGSPTTNKPGDNSNARTTGTSGSTITMENGTTFTYTNEFGGDWVFDPKDPFKGGGKAQSWSPRIGEEWKFGEDIIRGVNLGGWLVTEPFIVPGLYEKWRSNNAGIEVVDEFTLCQAMGDQVAEEMENHYRTFITEKDIAEIAAAGLNWLRIPIGFWAIETIDGEPYLEGVSWTYFLKALTWARKYGLRIYLDLHALPGSQNGWNHSGKVGSINVMKGVMGIANAQRTLTYLRIFTQFISQPQYKDVVLMLGVLNEVRYELTGADAVRSFYSAAYEAIRGASGIGAGNGPYVVIHSAFQGPDIWEGFLAGADRVVLDQHPYLAFQGFAEETPTASLPRPCDQWAAVTNRSQTNFGITVGGEFSTAVNNCGLWLEGPESPTQARCAVWDNWAAWDQTWMEELRQITLATMDALQNYFYWTWKIGDSTVLGTSSCPMWHYRLGLERGWIPKDPREAAGHCAAQLGVVEPFSGEHPVTATGGTGAGAQVATVAFPPAALLPSAVDAAAVALLPTYTPTGTLITLAAPTFTGAPSVDAGNGWNNPVDNSLAYVPISGCQYPDAYDSEEAPLPAAPICGV